MVRREIDRRIEPHRVDVDDVGNPHDAEMQLPDAGVTTLLAPDVDHFPYVRNLPNAVDQQHRFAFEPQVARVPQDRHDVGNEPPCESIGVALADDHVAFAAVPPPTPVLIRPANAERKVRLTAL